MPSYQEIRDLIREKKDVLEKKAEQGFTKLLIVPFGMKLDDLVEKYKELLLKHKAEEKTFCHQGKGFRSRCSPRPRYERAGL